MLQAGYLPDSEPKDHQESKRRPPSLAEMWGCRLKFLGLLPRC